MDSVAHTMEKAACADIGATYSMADSKLDSLLDRFARQDRLALARLITRVENRSAEVSTVMERIYARTGHAYVIGVTGAPGAGKSTLVNQLVIKYRAQNKLVAVLAIDPSSPFSGGAVLGDRVQERAAGVDVDVITVGDRRSESEDLMLPHPKAAQRAFVLAPWHDIEPDAELLDAGPVVELLAKTGLEGVRRRDDLSLNLQ